jgi:hypothetical protein
MVTYFPGPDILVTDRAVVVFTPGPVKFRLDRMSDARVVRGDMAPACVLTGRLAVVALVSVVAAWPWAGNTGRMAAVVIAVALCASAAALRYFLPRFYELRVMYDDVDVCLYESNDLTRFGQVKRALVRALEAERRRARMLSEPRPWPVNSSDVSRRVPPPTREQQVA